MSYSQNNEEQAILKFFGDRKINCLSIGENSGEVLSNVRQIILDGSKAVLVEPAPKPFAQLAELYADRDDVYCLNFAIADFIGKTVFYDSGSHLSVTDHSLLSTMNTKDYDKWKGTTEFKEIIVDVIDVASMLKLSPYDRFGCISIDAESCDLIILKQINLSELGCELLCIEHNSSPEILSEIKEYCAKFGLTNEILRNAENIILTK